MGYKGRRKKRATDGGDSAAFLSFFYAQAKSCSRSESTPAQPPLTQTVRHSAEVINKRKSIWVEVIRRHTAPLEQDGLYGVKQLTTVFSMEVKVKGQNARCLKIPRSREQSLKLLEALKVKLPEVLPSQFRLTGRLGYI